MPASIGRLSADVGRRHPVAVRRRRWSQNQWGVCEHCGTRQEISTLLLNGPGLRWLLTTIFPQHPSPSQQAASSRVWRVMSAFCEATRGVGDTWATCSMLLRGIWARSFSLSKLTFSSRLGSLLLRWKTVDTIFAVLSFSFQVWRYLPIVAISFLSTPSTACQPP